MNKLDKLFEIINNNPAYTGLIKEELTRAKTLMLESTRWVLKNISRREAKTILKDPVLKDLVVGAVLAKRNVRGQDKKKKDESEISANDFVTKIHDLLKTTLPTQYSEFWKPDHIAFLSDDRKGKNINKQKSVVYFINKTGLDTSEAASDRITSINGVDVYFIEALNNGKIKKGDEDINVSTKFVRQSENGIALGGVDTTQTIDTKPEIDATSQLTTNIPLPTLKRGSRGEEVKKLQTILFNDQTEWDGKFGTKTKAFLTAWQQVNSLKLDGIYGPKSYERMKQTNGTWSLGKTETGANGSVKQNKTDLGNYIYTELIKKKSASSKKKKTSTAVTNDKAEKLKQNTIAYKDKKDSESQYEKRKIDKNIMDETKPAAVAKGLNAYLYYGSGVSFKRAFKSGVIDEPTSGTIDLKFVDNLKGQGLGAFIHIFNTFTNKDLEVGYLESDIEYNKNITPTANTIQTIKPLSWGTVHIPQSVLTKAFDFTYGSRDFDYGKKTPKIYLQTKGGDSSDWANKIIYTKK